MVDPNCDLTFNIDKKMLTSSFLTPEINIKKTTYRFSNPWMSFFVFKFIEVIFQQVINWYCSIMIRPLYL